MKLPLGNSWLILPTELLEDADHHGPGQHGPNSKDLTTTNPPFEQVP